MLNGILCNLIMIYEKEKYLIQMIITYYTYLYIIDYKIINIHLDTVCNTIL